MKAPAPALSPPGVQSSSPEAIKGSTGKPGSSGMKGAEKGKSKFTQTYMKGSGSTNSPTSPPAPSKGGKGKSGGGGGAVLGFPTPPEFTPLPLPYAMSSPFITPQLKLNIDMRLWCPCLPGPLTQSLLHRSIII
eukprot:3060141-Amphidinium_carterae.4